MKIRYHAKAFPAGPPWGVTTGNRKFTATWSELVWAAVTVGRRNAAVVTQFQTYSVMEMLYRTFMIFANLREDKVGLLRQTKAYKALDRSEKGAVSFFIGMTVAKLVAARVMSVPWLTHMSHFSGGTSLSPDLVGRQISAAGVALPHWLVIEAKGRTNTASAATIKEAVNQAKSAFLLYANGSLVAPLRVASVAHFSKGSLRIHLEDPPADGRAKPRQRVRIADEEFFRAYYKPLMTLLNAAPQRRKVQTEDGLFVVADFTDIQVSVGLHEDIFNGKGKAPRAPSPTAKGQAHAKVFADGVYVELGARWSSEKMSVEPEMR